MVKRLETLEDIAAIQKQAEGIATDKGAADLFHLAYKERSSTAKMADLAYSTRVASTQKTSTKNQMMLM